MEKKKVRVLSDFRVTIPEEARRRLPIKIGEELEFTVEGKRLIYAVKGLPEDPVLSMLGLVKGEAQKTSEVEEKLKRSRG